MSSATPEPGAPTKTPEKFYRERREEFLRRAREVGQRSTLLTRLRIGTFLAAVAPFLAIETAPEGWGWPLAAVGTAFLLLFLVLVAVHRRIRRARNRHLRLAALAGEGLARLRRDWSALPRPNLPDPDPEHPYALDLDVFGDASLARLLRAPGTPTGRRTLEGWLEGPGSPDEVARRQEAVRELAPVADFRDELTLAAEPARGASPAMAGRFQRWAEAGPWLLDRPVLIWTSRLLPVATVTLLLGHLAGPLTQPLWILPVAATLLVLHRHGDALREGIEPASEHEGAVRAYQDLLALAAAPPGDDPGFRAPELERIRSSIGAPSESGDGPQGPDPAAHREIGRLRRILDSADVRSSGMVHFPLQLLFLWDFHVLLALERWKRRSGERVGEWLDAAGELEALSALAGLAHDHPDWTFPSVGDREPARLEGRALGHPLLPPEECVRNDAALGPPGTFLLVTGSNMSGKSTLLRAIGLNAVLAQAGGPVCAAELALPPLQVWTSMRLQDSLSRGVSFFMAELQRLREVVEAARGAGPERRTLYLLDEILQGTNTAERQIAARRIVRSLLATEAIGAVTTHDLTLADAEEIRSRSQAVHFREHVEKGTDPETGRETTRITFDYRLREGVATSRNALQLMEAVGLGGDDEDETPVSDESEAADSAPLEGT